MKHWMAVLLLFLLGESHSKQAETHHLDWLRLPVAQADRYRILTERDVHAFTAR